MTTGFVVSPGEEIEMVLSEGAVLRLVAIVSVTHRKFSTVAQACDAQGARYFVKQFARSTDERFPDQFIAELAADDRLAEVFTQCGAALLRPVASCVDRLLILYKWVDMEPLSDLWRRERSRFMAMWPACLDVLARLSRESELLSQLGYYGDIRNFAQESGGNLGARSLLAFDSASVDGRQFEPAAALVASVAFLSYGRPLRVTLRGAPFGLIMSICKVVQCDTREVVRVLWMEISRRLWRRDERLLSRLAETISAVTLGLPYLGTAIVALLCARLRLHTKARYT
jgi:hypothetical protein